MVELAVDQEDCAYAGVSELAGRLKLREGLELGENVGGRVDEDPTP